jgi:YihY family inner membrane protein
MRRREDAGIHRLRAIASQVTERLGGVPAVRTLRAVMDTYDAAGGGLVAGGLAYAALVALLPGLLLVIAVVGVVVDDPTVRADVAASIARAVPPLEGIAATALNQVAGGAVPTSIVAILGLLWGSSRFYTALDDAFSRIFHNAPRRNLVQRSVRGVVLMILVIIVPIAALVSGSVVSWLLDVAPGGSEIGNLARTTWRIASPLASVVLFVGVTAIVYRFVPARPVSLHALGRPALAVGLAIAAFTQVFTFIAPRLVGAAALYGTFVTVFALLAWLSVSLNVLLLGGAWTRVRLLGRSNPRAHEVPAVVGHRADPGTKASG